MEKTKHIHFSRDTFDFTRIRLQLLRISIFLNETSKYYNIMNSVIKVVEPQRDVGVVDNPTSRLSDEIDHFKELESSVLDLIFCLSRMLQNL